MKIRVRTKDSGEREVEVDRYPDQCPKCHRGIKAEYFGGFLNKRKKLLFFMAICPFDDCGIVFSALYHDESSRTGTPYFELSTSGLITYTPETVIPKEVADLSPSFKEIFNQASAAEGAGLDLIAGPGFRKALEFLIKDYLIKYEFLEDKEKQAKVEKAFLGTCIAEYIAEGRIKSSAAKASWLGNDETHYYRKWTDLDIKDLKKLISMTVNWIELVLVSDDYDAKMEKPKAGNL
jgi:hypothetical protein